MLFASSLVSAAFIMLPGVIAVTQPEEAGLVARATCPDGSYNLNSTACAFCPPGFYCTGGKAAQCGTGTYQSNIGASNCTNTSPGFYVNVTGSTAQTPCYPGSYQPYAKQSFCFGAPKGRFQSQSGQACVCGTCCGWSAPLDNYNVNPVNCTGSTPNAYPSSGDGCISKSTGCIHAQTCQQSANGTCPADTICG